MSNNEKEQQEDGWVGVLFFILFLLPLVGLIWMAFIGALLGFIDIIL